MSLSKKILQALKKIGFLLSASLFFNACTTFVEKTDKPFRLVPSSESGIDFKNTITETEEFNILNFHYIYNGGGVGVGDFDKNGLLDLVFSGNETPSKIYLNLGNLQFKDITDASNFKTKGWTTGISIVDLNADGLDDIYLSVGGLNCDGNCKNQLFINQGINEKGIPAFAEKAANYNLDDGLYTQQTAFFDYDQDGDLDVYLLHNVIDQRDKNAPSEKKFINVKSRDRLLRNDSPRPQNLTAFEEPVSVSNPNEQATPGRVLPILHRDGGSKFTDVSDSVGITHRGYGLGITINDFNADNLPDIYIANDFLSDDLMYLNLGSKNGKHLGFREASQEFLKHQSYNAMGVDVADINADNRPDILVLDMMPEYHERQKTMIGFMNYDKFQMTLRQGYAPQFIRNTLQIHNGFLNEKMLPFSEVGYLADIHATDWSWTPLLADFDNDGDRDIYVTNGYGKDITDLDFINFSNQASGFGSKEAAQKRLFEAIQKMEDVKIPNYFFENQGNLSFKNQSANWSEKTPSISNGAVYSDLDNDGDLDLISNNINDEAFILENRFREKTGTNNDTSTQNENSNFLKIKLEGTPQNSAGIGSKIQIWTGEKTQLHYQSPVRGYLSSVSQIAHFGLGKSSKIDSLKIVWANGLVEKQQNIKANQTLTLAASNALKASDNFPFAAKVSPFKKVKPFEYTHRENPFQDFDAQPLLLHQLSRQGPCLAAANIDGKPGDELFIGGAKGFPGKIFYENKNSTWRSVDLPDADREDTDAAFFDYENDGDLDLYVVSGGTEFSAKAEELKDRIYLNDGNGNFSKAEIPNLSNSSGGSVVANDYDQNGDVNLFIGGRVVPRNYPKSPESSLMVKFMEKDLDYADKLANPLAHNGMVSDAIWADFDNDEKMDLITVGEWSGINFYKNKGGGFLKLATPGRLSLSKSGLTQNPTSTSSVSEKFATGMWNCITAADFDNDGDLDFLLGNLGENSRLHASAEEPMTLFTGDFDENGSPDPLIGQFYVNKKGERKSYPLHSRDDVMKQLVKLKKQYVKYADFAQATFPELLGEVAGDPNYELRITNFESSYLENLGDGNFDLKPLPKEAQIAPIQDILADDFDGDGNVDALLIGNDFTAEKTGGWYDAFNGLFLRGKGDGTFEPVSAAESGFYVEGDGRSLVQLTDRTGKRLIVAGQNSGELKFFEY